MFGNLASNLVFNEIEYFTYINMWLLYLLFRLIIMYLLLSSSLLYYITLDFNVTLMEFFFSLFTLWFLRLIISPSLIILLDFDLILIPCFYTYCLGYQWAWTSNPSFTLSFLLGHAIGCNYLEHSIDHWNYYFDHYIVSSFLLNSSIIPFYSFDMNRSLTCPLYSTFKLWVLSLDVIHCLGLYSFGIKIDGIPGHIHLAVNHNSTNIIGSFLYLDSIIPTFSMIINIYSLTRTPPTHARATIPIKVKTSRANLASSQYFSHFLNTFINREM